MLKGTHEFKCTQNYVRAFQEFRQQVIVTPILTLLVGSKDYSILPKASEDRLECVVPQGNNAAAYIFLQFKFMKEITRPLI